jgi:hypothetical protein
MAPIQPSAKSECKVPVSTRNKETYRFGGGPEKFGGPVLTLAAAALIAFLDLLEFIDPQPLDLTRGLIVEVLTKLLEISEDPFVGGTAEERAVWIVHGRGSDRNEGAGER